ncbi:MAG: FKBP-type peptidyl-prolyl cis-trans isomerase, partial [Bacteroidales bacterium]|nr:FKBP-type peptidyl-prolyl cis-trans isomerase [Bacteroidales bacterium]
MRQIKTILLATVLLLANAMTAQTDGYQKTPTGLFYKIITKGEGAQPQVGELMDVSISCMVNDTIVIIPESENTMMMGTSLFSGDLFEGMAMMHVGDSASFIVDIDSTFITLFQSPGLPWGLLPTDVMRFEVRLDDCYPESEYMQRVATKMKQERDARVAQLKAEHPNETADAVHELMEYLVSNRIRPVATESGLYYLKTQDGNGERPVFGQMVRVHYTGKLLDGTVFDSSYDRNEPIIFPVGVGQVIAGWDEGIMLMSKGERGVLYIPYYLGYGDKAAGDKIAPFSNLIFEVELIDFQ